MQTILVFLFHNLFFVVYSHYDLLKYPTDSIRMNHFLKISVLGGYKTWKH